MSLRRAAIFTAITVIISITLKNFRESLRRRRLRCFADAEA
jgi:hypothetical protein